MIDRSWASLAVNMCVLRGFDHFFLAPGSRCTPLTLAVAHHDNAHVMQHVDERALAFAALGYARATGKLGVFICTSGTAVANALPAVIEASAECLPMLLLTGDRPPELRGSGANQTIDQLRIYGEYTRWFFDMPCPTEHLGLEFVRSQMERAFDEASTGPVHLNWMFREPFGLDEMPRSAVVREVVDDEPTTQTRLSEFPISISGDTLLIAGGCRPQQAAAIESLAEQHGLPLLTDITSGLRGISPEVATEFNLPEPETIVHLGGRIVSKSWLSYLASLSNTRFVHVTPHDVQFNPKHLVLERHVAAIESIRLQPHSESSSPFHRAWTYAETSRRNAVRQVLARHGEQLTEPRLALELGSRLTEGHALFIGNSSPIRDFDRYAFWSSEQDIVVAANRGASGIDGLLATSIGFANGLARPTTVVLGDLSALHDLNSLALVARSPAPMTVIVINNHGGGIFDRLPVARHTPYFEQYFATPHEFDFEQAAAMFGITYRRVEGITTFAAAYNQASHSSNSTIIEATTDRSRNQRVRQEIQEAIQT